MGGLGNRRDTCDGPPRRDRSDRPRRAARRGDRGLPGAGRGGPAARPRGVRGRAIPTWATTCARRSRAWRWSRAWSATRTGPGHGLEAGRRIAGYRIVRELGRGGMGIVYEAVHVGLDRPVALKVLGTHAAPDSTGRRRFLNEARTAAGLHHTHIVPVFDVGQVGGLCYYAMQRIEGSGLDRVLRHLRHDRSIAAGSSLGLGQVGGTPSRASGPGAWAGVPRRRAGLQPPAPSTEPAPVAPAPCSGPARRHRLVAPPGRAPRARQRPGQPRREPDDEPPPFEPPRGSAYYRWVAEIGRQAAEALAHAHHRGIVHRDVKPSNLLVDARGIVWVADFGLARRLADPSQTQHDSLLGTPRYMSPEQARIGPIDGRSDVYSLGATLYELLTLRPPFEGRTAAELVEQISGARAGRRPASSTRGFPATSRRSCSRRWPSARRPLRHRDRPGRRPEAVPEPRAGAGPADQPAGPVLAVRPPAPEPDDRLDHGGGDRARGADGGLRPDRCRSATQANQASAETRRPSSGRPKRPTAPTRARCASCSRRGRR